MQDRWRNRANGNTRAVGREARRSLRQKRLANMTRSELINAIGDKAKWSLSRAILKGEVELYGYFAENKRAAGWIISVQPEDGPTRLVYITECVETRETMVLEMDRAPWRYWAGESVTESEINLGDRPAQYKTWKFQDEQANQAEQTNPIHS